MFVIGSVNAYTETFYVCAGGNGTLPETNACATAYNETHFNTAGNWDTDDSDDGLIGPNDLVIILDDGGPLRPASPGGAYSAFLTIQQSGLSGKPITIQGESGGSPVVLGSLSKNDSGDWTNESENIWKTANNSFTIDPGFVLVGSESQANVGVREDAKVNLSADREWWYDAANDCVYLYNDGGNPATEHSSIEIGAVENIIEADEKDYITAEDLTLKHSTRSGFLITNGDNWIIDNCTVKYGGGHYTGSTCDGNGINTKKGMTNSSVTNCFVSQWQDVGIVLETGYSTDNASNITFSNNTVDRCGGGIKVGIVGPDVCSITTVLVSENTITNSNAGWSAGGSCPSQESGYAIRGASNANGAVSGVTIRDNDLSGFGGSGIDLRGGLNYTITRNKIYNGDRSYTALSAVGGIKARGDTKNVTGDIYANLIYNNDVPGMYIYYNDAILNIYSNTIYNCGGTVTSSSNTGVRFTNSDQFNFKNNVVYSKSGSFSALHVNGAVPNASLDYNVYYKDSGALILYPWSTTYNVSQFSSYQTAISDEANSINADPLFVNASCIDNGTDVNLTQDFEGNPVPQPSWGDPDIGAYEYYGPVTVYVDATNGNDSYNGLYPTFQGGSNGPWKTISKVNAASFNPGDTIKFKKGEVWYEILKPPSSGSSGSPITFTSYGSGAAPITDNSAAATTWTQAYGNELLTDGGLEAWDSATNLTSWTEVLAGTSTVNREGTEKHGGTYSCRFDIDADNANAEIDQTGLSLIAGSKYYISLWYKTASAKNLKSYFFVYVDGTGYYLQSDGSWAIPGTYNWLLATNTSWTEATITTDAIPSGTLGNKGIKIMRNSAVSSSIYIDDVSVKKALDNLYEKTFANEPKVVLEDGDLLTYVLWDTDAETTYASMSAGTFTVDTTNKIAYVWCTDGLDPDTHTMRVSTDAGSGSDRYNVYILDKEYITIDGLHLKNAARAGYFYYLNAFANKANLIVQNCTVENSGAWGIYLGSAHGGDDSYNITGIDVYNNTVLYSAAHGIAIGSASSSFGMEN
jgi:hypothetical protein